MTDATVIRLAIVSGLLRQYPLDLALAKIAEAGYDGVELWGGQHHGYVLDMVEEVGGDLALDVARAEAIRDLCAANDLPIVCLTPEQLIYPINWLIDDVPPFDGPALRQRSRRMTELSIDAAAALGCDRVVLVTPTWQWTRQGDGWRRATKSEVISAAIEEIAAFTRHAEARDVTILFEPLVHHDTNGIETLEETAELLERVPSPNLQLMLDMGHVAVTANRRGLDPVASFREHLRVFGDRVRHIHVDDNAGAVDSHLVPGAGTIDLAGMTAALLESGYQGWLSAELGILGEYAMPEHAEPLLHEARRQMAALLESAAATARR
jgi:fructoselysine 3-epimerase